MKNVLTLTTMMITSIFLISSCATSPTGRRQLTFMPDSQMAQMGDQSFAEMKKTEKVSRDPVLNKKIKCIAERIVTAMDKDNDFKQWDVVVFDDKAINAFALPGKNIGVYTGLINAAQNNAQIASVIGHEVGHVLANHGNERVSQNLIVQGGLLVADVALDTGDSAKDQLILASLGVGATLGILLPYSRKHESEADQIGLELMAKAGFNPQEAVNFWKVMNKQDKNAPPELLSTHPANTTRINELEAKMLPAKQIYLKTMPSYSACP